jgi:hypothetical protein
MHRTQREAPTVRQSCVPLNLSLGSPATKIPGTRDPPPSVHQQTRPVPPITGPGLSRGQVVLADALDLRCDRGGVEGSARMFPVVGTSLGHLCAVTKPRADHQGGDEHCQDDQPEWERGQHDDTQGSGRHRHHGGVLSHFSCRSFATPDSRERAVTAVGPRPAGPGLTTAGAGDSRGEAEKRSPNKSGPETESGTGTSASAGASWSACSVSCRSCPLRRSGDGRYRLARGTRRGTESRLQPVGRSLRRARKTGTGARECVRQAG